MKTVRYLLLQFIALSALVGCAATGSGYRSAVIERPNPPVKETLVVVEGLGVFAPGKAKDAMPHIDEPMRDALDRYQSGLYAAVRRDFVRVLSDNGIKAKLIAIPSVVPATPATQKLPADERSAWQYTLWIRQGKSMIECRGGNCEAFFETIATLFDTASGRTLWSVQEGGETYRSEKDWASGKIYGYLLERLSSDGVISLPKAEPVINIK